MHLRISKFIITEIESFIEGLTLAIEIDTIASHQKALTREGRMDYADLLMYVSAVIYCIAPAFYVWGVHRREIAPNPATWVISAVVAPPNAVFYYRNAPEDEKIMAILSIVSAIVLVFIFAYSFFKKRFVKMGWVEWTAVGMTGVVLIVWLAIRKHEGADGFASVLVQAPMVMSFAPTWYGLVKGKGQENFTPWVLGISAYFLQIAAMLIAHDPDPVHYAYPVLNGVCGNGIVILCIVYYRRKYE